MGAGITANADLTPCSPFLTQAQGAWSGKLGKPIAIDELVGLIPKPDQMRGKCKVTIQKENEPTPMLHTISWTSSRKSKY